MMMKRTALAGALLALEIAFVALAVARGGNETALVKQVRDLRPCARCGRGGARRAHARPPGRGLRAARRCWETRTGCSGSA